MSVALILAGAALMVVNVRRLQPVFGALQLVEPSRRAWLQRLIRAHRAFMLVFIMGYLATAAAFAVERSGVTSIFVGVVFALGSLFVYIGVTIQARLVGEILTTVGRLVPICANCKRIRLEGANPDDMSSWKPVEAYFASTRQAEFSHGICPDCNRLLYPEFQKLN